MEEEKVRGVTLCSEGHHTFIFNISKNVSIPLLNH